MQIIAFSRLDNKILVTNHPPKTNILQHSQTSYRYLQIAINLNVFAALHQKVPICMHCVNVKNDYFCHCTQQEFNLTGINEILSSWIFSFRAQMGHWGVRSTYLWSRRCHCYTRITIYVSGLAKVHQRDQGYNMTSAKSKIPQILKAQIVAIWIS